eukprot:1719581-Pleurochrysis_carterae.AAC.1
MSRLIKELRVLAYYGRLAIRRTLTCTKVGGWLVIQASCGSTYAAEKMNKTRGQGSAEADA